MTRHIPDKHDLVAAGLASEAVAAVREALSAPTPRERWERLTQRLLRPDHPFELHKLLHQAAFSDWPEHHGPPPAWFPPANGRTHTNLEKLMTATGTESLPALHAWSVAHRADFWDLMVRTLGIRFRKPYTKVLDISQGAERPAWFPGASLNITDSCFLPAKGAPAIVYQDEEGPIQTVSREALLALTNRVGNGLRTAGLEPGDAVGVVMPMTVESVAIYLGVIKAGCAVVSVADSFAPREIGNRLRLGKAKAVFTQDILGTADKAQPLYDKISAADAPHTIVRPRSDRLGVHLREGDLSWSDFLSDNEQMESVPRQPADHANILFSSGTTGEPKAIPWSHAAPIKCAADAYIHHDTRPGDVLAWPTSLGWMMGPWLIYAALVNRATMALYYGAATGRGFGRFVQDARVTMLGLVPSLVRAWRRRENMKGLDWSAIRAFSSTGECSNADEMLYLMSLAGYRPVIEYCGGSEIAGGYITGSVVQPSAPATFSTPALGLDFVVLDDEGSESENGELFLIPPSVGLSNELLNTSHHDVYFKNTPPLPRSATARVQAAGSSGPVPLRRHGDHVEKLPNGYYRMHGRTDDTMNLYGIKISSAEIERLLASVEGIHETAAVAVPSPDGGPSRLVIYGVPEPETDASPAALKRAIQQKLRRDLNPLFKVSDLVMVPELPRTASNKVMRRVLRTRYAE